MRAGRAEAEEAEKEPFPSRRGTAGPSSAWSWSRSPHPRPTRTDEPDAPGPAGRTEPRRFQAADVPDRRGSRRSPSSRSPSSPIGADGADGDRARRASAAHRSTSIAHCRRGRPGPGHRTRAPAQSVVPSSPAGSQTPPQPAERATDRARDRVGPPAARGRHRRAPRRSRRAVDARAVATHPVAIGEAVTGVLAVPTRHRPARDRRARVDRRPGRASRLAWPGAVPIAEWHVDLAVRARARRIVDRRRPPHGRSSAWRVRSASRSSSSATCVPVDRELDEVDRRPVATAGRRRR